jgi:hypothetical protein
MPEEGETKAQACANAFHEKAGRSQEIFRRRVATVAILPSAVVDEQFARCKLGVLVSAGAATCLATSTSSHEMKLGQAIDAVTGTRLLASLHF